eukprot:scaffold32514_cov57-Cyclotella_meneghiniana.AAC.3
MANLVMPRPPNNPCISISPSRSQQPVFVFLPLPPDQIPLFITCRLCWVLVMKAFISICHQQTLLLPFTFPTTSLLRCPNHTPRMKGLYEESTTNDGHGDKDY